MSGIFRIGARVGRVGFAIVWSLVAAELFLRFFNPVAVAPRHVMAGAYGIRVNEPNRAYWHRSADFRIQIRTNSRGIRADEEIPYDKPPGVKRIVVLGDSFGMGYEVKLEDTFLARMEGELRAAGKNVQIVNLSVSGYGNAEELVSLEAEGLKYHPDLVLLCWDDTDYEDNVRCGLYALEDGKLVRKNATYLPAVDVQERLNRIPGYDWASSNLDLYSFVREWVSFNVAKPVLVLLRDPIGSQARNADAGAETRDPRAQWAGYPTALTVAILEQIGKVCDDAGAGFMILDIPQHRENSAFWSAFPDMPPRHKRDLDVVSPVPEFERSCGEHLIYWTRSQAHLTPFGCQLVAHDLATTILRQHKL